jgi:triphosphoribosyl-dephospho-CoA synthase
MNLAAAPRLAPRAADADPRPCVLSRLATRSLLAELVLYPKPGLVSLRDTGSHSDMDASTFVRSLFSLRGYFADIASAGAAAAPFPALRELGIRAEASMLAATGGINTHRGAIFVLGLLCAAAGRAQAQGETPTDDALRRSLNDAWGRALASFAASAGGRSHGVLARIRYGATGAKGEARRGFPAVFDIALPALRAARARGADVRHARLSAFFALLAGVDDTNVLHRGGASGLAFVRDCALGFRADGDVFRAGAIARAEAIHRAFVARRLSPGGCADLLAAALFVHELQDARA